MKHLAEYFSDFEEVEINEYVEYLIGRLDDFTEKFAEFFSNLKLHKEEPLFWFKQEYITNLNYLVDQYYWGNVIEDLCEKFGKNLGTIFRGHLRRLSLSAYLQLGVHSTPPNVVTIRRLVRQYFRNGIFNLFNLMYWDFYIHSYISSYDRSLKDSVGALLLTLALNINCFLGIEPENNTWRKLISNVALGKDFLIDLVFIIYRNEYNREDSRDIEELEKLLSTKSDKNKSILRRVGLLNQNKKSYR